MRLFWLAPSLLLACAHAASPGSSRLDVTDKRPVGASPHFECMCVTQAPRPEFLLDPIRLGPEPGALPYTTDGRTSAYTLSSSLRVR